MGWKPSPLYISDSNYVNKAQLLGTWAKSHKRSILNHKCEASIKVSSIHKNLWFAVWKTFKLETGRSEVKLSVDMYSCVECFSIFFQRRNKSSKFLSLPRKLENEKSFFKGTEVRTLKRPLSSPDQCMINYRRSVIPISFPPLFSKRVNTTAFTSARIDLIFWTVASIEQKCRIEKKRPEHVQMWRCRLKMRRFYHSSLYVWYMILLTVINDVIKVRKKLVWSEKTVPDILSVTAFSFIQKNASCPYLQMSSNKKTTCSANHLKQGCRSWNP